MTGRGLPNARAKRPLRDCLRSLIWNRKGHPVVQSTPDISEQEQYHAALIAEFERVWPWLEKAVRRFGNTHTKEHLLMRVLFSRAQLWTEKNAALITSIERYDNGYLEVRGWLGGGSIGGLRVIEKRVELWAKSIGAQRLTILGRRGWLRALTGWRELAVMIAKDI